MTAPLKPGRVYTHDRKLDPLFIPGPGGKYTDAPKARIMITAVRADRVYYCYAHDAVDGRGRGLWYTSRSEFIRRFIA